MKWKDLPRSILEVQLKAKRLEHPTNANFDAAAWTAAIEGLADPAERDVNLAVAAIHYGLEIASLRDTGVPLVTEKFGRKYLVRLLAAYSNQQFLTLRDKTLKQIKDGRRNETFDMERAQQHFVANVGGQEMPADDHVTNLVDSMPHWLFHIWKLSDDETGDDAPFQGLDHAAQFAARASQIVSIEHSLRQLWLNSFWCGNTIRKVGTGLVEAPFDRALAEQWFVWDLRQHMLVSFEQGVDAGAHIMAGGKLPPITPAISRTVIRMERPNGRNRKFITGRAIGAKADQRSHVSERDMLERLYTGLFLDEPLPRSPTGTLTCRELSMAWWVLSDLARLAMQDLGKHSMLDGKSLERYALTIDAQHLVDVLISCLEIEAPRAYSIIDWLTCDPSNTSRLFAKSFWSEPLIPEPGTERRHLLLAPLLVGSPVKRVEAWMQRGGICDSSGVKGRGKPYERHVRREVVDAIEKNPLLSDADVAEHGLKRKGNSEEIDLLIRIANTVITGEIKCFVAPSDPIEKHNHLANLTKATEQAEAKRAWVDDNRDVIAAALGIDDRERAATLTLHPVVVLNHGLGIGLERNGVPVVDLHYLTLLLASGSYNRGARFERGVGVMYDNVALYGSQAEFEERLGNLLNDPPPLKRYHEQIRWRQIPFPTSDGTQFYIELPALSETPLPDALRDMPMSAGKRARR